MRSREEIIKQLETSAYNSMDKHLILEVLLDIREMLGFNKGALES